MDSSVDNAPTTRAGILSRASRFIARQLTKSPPLEFHLNKLKDTTCVPEYAVAMSNRFEVFHTLKEPWGVMGCP